jgi:peptide/nickel transport system permease protein
VIGYIVRRLLVSVIVVIGIAALSFILLHAINGSPALAVLGTKATPQALASWNKQHGYDRPLLLQFVSYLNQLIHLNLGYSYKQGQSVWALFKENAGRSAYLSGASLVLALLIAIPLGIAQAVKRNSIGDYAATGITFTLYSMPQFFLGLVFIEVFALKLHWLPAQVGDNITTTWQAVTHPNELVMPIVSLALLQVAGYSRYMRSAALDNLGQDYIRLARAKGLSERAVLFRHLLRNSILPMVTLIGLSVPLLLSGNVLIEDLFNYSGLGLLFINSLGTEDYFVLMALVLVGGILTVIGNLIADVAVTVADPRVRL